MQSSNLGYQQWASTLCLVLTGLKSVASSVSKVPLMKQTFTCILTACLLVASHPSLAHGGGTDSHGCHVESATGLRHCHTPKSDDEDTSWETVGIVVGGLLVGALVYRWLKDVDLTSSIGSADSDPSDLGIRINADETGAQSASIYWRYRF